MVSYHGPHAGISGTFRKLKEMIRVRNEKAHVTHLFDPSLTSRCLVVSPLETRDTPMPHHEEWQYERNHLAWRHSTRQYTPMSIRNI